MLYPVIVAVLTAAAFAQEAIPGFCTETTECFKFKVLCEADTYELRRYEKSVWVATDVESLVYEHASMTGFRKLFKYITGDNDAMQQINMTAPVLIKVPHGGKFWQKTKYTIHFMLPSYVAENPPSPFNPEVYFVRMPAMTMYVKSFGGWILTVTSKIYSGLLSNDLKDKKKNFDNGFHYMASYNRPTKMLNRHNEVWYMATESPNCEA
ncbi:heme-binding protein 2-like [Petromyzon marinus]|uniref:Heme-binding protein 1 n=1 Tax=Petromyzon marinus TaxID=7757 RepID=A0AAJ7TEA7_PETMA|nr:heme-binding protein 2-like [Petromyzon marinus]